MVTAVIAATTTAVPEHSFTTEEAKTQIAKLGLVSPQHLPAILSMFDHALVQQRYSVFPLEYLVQRRSLTQISEEYRTHAIELGRRVAQTCLMRAGIKPEDVDFLITVSCTGIMLPSLDAYLINDLGFRPDVRRLPITELGCAAGAAALSRARDFIAAYPNATVLIVSVELSTLTLQAQDGSIANLVSTALFGDGAAAAVVTGLPARGFEIIDSASYLFRDTYDALGFVLRDGGLHIVLSNEVAALIRGRIKEITLSLLARNKLAPDQLSFFMLHPGGRSLLDAIENELGLDRNLTQPSWDVLRNFGNISSATVFFVLREWQKRCVAAGQQGILAAFGPGFSAEMLLLQAV